MFLLVLLWWEFKDRHCTDRNPVGATDRERVLERLERGETVRVPRWHGHDLELSGEVVVDAEALPTDDETDQE